MEEKDLEFYFKNQQKINQIAKFKFSVRDHIANEVEKVCDTSNDGFKLYKSKGNLNKRLRYFLSPQNNELMITIVYDGLLTADKNMHIMVELKGATLKNKSQYNTIDFSSEEKEILVEGFENNPNNSWAHFAAVPYILEEHEILNLSGFIHEKLEDDNLLSVYRKLNDYLLAKKKEKELVG